MFILVSRILLMLITSLNLSVKAVALPQPKNEIRWEWSTKPDRKFKIPQIVGPSELIERRVNQAIDIATRNLRCDGDEWFKKEFADFVGLEFNVTLRVDYASNSFFSVYATESFYCGGAYPTNYATFSMNFDLSTGDKVEFGDLFSNYSKDKEQIMKIIFAEQIKKYGRYEVNNKIGCSGVFEVRQLVEETSEFDFTISASGINVQPRWPHVIEACAKRVKVPFLKLKSYARLGSILDRMAKTHDS